MRGKASVPLRLARMEQQRSAIDLEAQVQALAQQYGLHPNEVRHELEEVRQRIARYGPEPIDAMVRRLAEEFGLDEAELRQEYEANRARRTGMPQ